MTRIPPYCESCRKRLVLEYSLLDDQAYYVCPECHKVCRADLIREGRI